MKLEKLDKLDTLEKLDKLDTLEVTTAGIQKTLDSMKQDIEKHETQIKDVENGVGFWEQEVEDVKNATANNKEEIEDIKSSLKHGLLEVQALRMRNAELRKSTVELDTYSRKENLVFDGIEEKEEENTWECLASILEQKLGIKDAKSIRIQWCHRLGRKSKDTVTPKKQSVSTRETSARPRQVIVRFLCFQDRMKVWSSRRLLKGTNIFINEDFPKAIQTARRVLTPHLKVALSKDKTAFIRMDKPVIKGRAYDVHHIPREIVYSGEDSPRTKKIDNHLYFSGRSSIFSNFFPAPMEVDGVHFNCNEQFYQFNKAVSADRSDKAREILATTDPAEQKQIGDAIKTEKSWYTEYGPEVMKQGIKEKFLQNPNLYHVLQELKDCSFVECNPYDKFWGNGVSMKNKDVAEALSWPGKNLLGTCYDEVCKEIFK